MKYFLLWYTIGVISILTAFTKVQSETCPVFGTDQSSLSRSTEERIFLNFESPSQCRGNVTSYRYCFYDSRVGGDDDDDEDSDSDSEDQSTYGAKLMIYRRNFNTTAFYSPVLNSITTLSLSRSDARGFRCLNAPLSTSIQIQENDIVGACVMDEGNINPLYLVGDTNENSDNFKLYQLDRSGYDDCTSSQIRSVDTGHTDFRQRRDFVLHVYANIAGVTASCRVGANPPASAPRTSSLQGTYLNTANSVSCTDRNAITSWHYCYYTSAVTPGQTYTMTVAVWRLDTTTNTYRVTAGSTRTITLVPVATFARIFCMEETLDSADSVFVMMGDVIGVVLPSSNPIPVVSSDPSSSSSLMRHSQSASAVDLLSSGFTSLTGTALHLYGTLEFTPPPPATSILTTSPLTTPILTTPPPTTAPPPTTPPLTSHSSMPAIPPVTVVEVHATATSESTNTDETVQATLLAVVEGTRDSDSANVNGPSIAAISISLVVLLVILATVTVIFAIVCFRRNKKKSRGSQGIANVAYEMSTQHINVCAKDIGVLEEKMYEEIDDPATAATADWHIYQDVEKPVYDQITSISPEDVVQEYAECLAVAKKGIAPGTKENPYHSPANTESDIYGELKKMKIPDIAGFSIEMGNWLGSGQFGTVHQATWKCTSKHTMEVAVKTLKDHASQEDRVKFLQEAAIMAQFRHPNVVTLHGVARKHGKIMIVVEILSKGDLLSFLKTIRPDPGELMNPSTPHLLLEFSQQIALGMTYLADKAFVHRDLAARNILISDFNICKIADFGMSRELQDTDYYVSSGGKIPFKWTSPEALRYKKYSTASDVWSYGCLLYEIWSVGHKPYENMGCVEILRKLDDGFRLPPPPGCPKRIYDLMILSWAKEPSERPGFRDMLLSLLENKSVVLMIPPKEADTHPQAAVLGAPLDAGEGMYKTLQNTYKT